VGATNNHYGVFGQFGESAPDPQAGLHDKSAEIVCGFERVRRFLFCSARKSRSALIQLARFDCVCGVQLYRSLLRAFMSHSKVHRSALMYGGQLP
jgi:hypothetical protein